MNISRESLNDYEFRAFLTLLYFYYLSSSTVILYV